MQVFFSQKKKHSSEQFYIYVVWEMGLQKILKGIFYKKFSILISLTENSHSVHLYANLKIRNTDLKMPQNITDIVKREIELKQVQKMTLQIRLDTLEK